jgi:Ca2+-binding EF-hand superfamily protein
VAAELARAGAATIDFEQFCALLLGQPAARGGRASSPARQRPLELPQLELDAAFRLFDMDGDGFVSIADFRAVLTAMRAPAGSVASLVAAADASGDGRLSRAEFAALLAQPPR